MTQKTPAELTNEINADIVAGVSGGITALTLNGILNDMVDSSVPNTFANFNTFLSLWLDSLPTDPAPLGSKVWYNNSGIPTRTP
jgi:hypothetical protein